MSSNIEIKKICKWCGNEFTARKTTTEYCSHRCSNLAYKERKRQKRLGEYQREYEYQESGKVELEKQEFLTPTQAAKLMGLCTKSIYNYISNGSIKVWRLCRKTLIRRKDLDALFTEISEQQRITATIKKQPITEFYTTKEVLEKFGISNSWLFKAAKENNFPKTIQRGKTLWSKSHIDRFFAKKKPQEDITEWYTVAEIQERFGMTLSAIYNLVSKEGIPKKKVGCEARYSKRHFDIAKGVAEPKEPEYYTMPEAMEHFNMTRDQLYHYIKTHGITKVKVGRIIKISKQELDNLFAPPTI